VRAGREEGGKIVMAVRRRVQPPGCDMRARSTASKVSGRPASRSARRSTASASSTMLQGKSSPGGNCAARRAQPRSDSHAVLLRKTKKRLGGMLHAPERDLRTQRPLPGPRRAGRAASRPWLPVPCGRVRGSPPWPGRPQRVWSWSRGAEYGSGAQDSENSYFSRYLRTSVIPASG
jgi:hypothetical protein